jgi:DNA-binding CsgD family transcriptional regulator/tetratricopeptide (TPR) repeat protein
MRLAISVGLRHDRHVDRRGSERRNIPPERTPGPPQRAVVRHTQGAQLLRGRLTELQHVDGVLQLAKTDGRGAVLMVTGQAGIGKSALLAETRRRARAEGFAVGWAKAAAVDEVAAGAPVLLALRSGDEPLLDAVSFRALAPVYDKRLWLADQIADLLEARAQRQPILIALDDLQFADPVSQFLLRALTARLAGAPIVWALAERGIWFEAAERTARDGLDATVEVEHLALGPLADSDAVALAADVVGHALSAHAAEQLRVAAGNPLLATQLAQDIANGHLNADREVMPTPLLTSLRARNRALASRTEDLLHLAAVWGRPLSLTDAAELLGLASANDVLDLLYDAVVLGLVDVTGDVIDFRHELIRDFFYDVLSPSAKIDLHRRCASLIMSGTEGSAVRAAPHAQAAARLGDRGGLTILRAAAEQSVGTLPRAAAELACTAFSLVEPDDPDWQNVGEACAEVLVRVQHARDAVGIVDQLLVRAPEPARRARLQVIAARALWMTGRLADISERVDSTLALPGVSSDLGARLTAAKALALTRVDSSAASATADDALRMAAGNDADVVLVAVQALAQAARNEGRFEQAFTHFHLLRTRFGPQHLSAEIMALQNLDRYADAQALLDGAFRGGGMHSDTVFPELLLAHQWQEWHLGHLDAAAATAETVLRISDELGNHANKIEAWIVLTIHAVLHKQFERAAELLRQTAADVAEIDPAHQPEVAPELALVRGYFNAARGDFAAAVAALEPMVRDATQRHHYWPRLQEWPRLLAGAAIAGHHNALAAQCIAQAELFAQRNPDVATITGIAAQTRGFVEHDWRRLGTAAAILADSPRTMLHARARADLGHVLIADGHKRRGTQELEHSLSLYEQLGIPLYLDEVHAALEGVGRAAPRRPRPPRPSFGWDSLTEAELTVARHIAAGETNRIAADALNVSVHTVNTHLRSTFAKLGLHSRVQLANAWNARSAAATPEK